jgi:hypothetical protein
MGGVLTAIRFVALRTNAIIIHRMPRLAVHAPRARLGRYGFN